MKTQTIEKLKVIATGTQSGKAHVLVGADYNKETKKIIVKKSPDYKKYVRKYTEWYNSHSTPQERNEDYKNFLDKVKGLDVALIRHLMADSLKTGDQVWSGEHFDFPMPVGEHDHIQQMEYDPLTQLIQEVND